jgi:hypothetical protein
VTGPHEDIVRCAIAAEGNGKVWVAYCAHRAGKLSAWVRPITAKGQASGSLTLGPEQNLLPPETAARHLSPVMCTDQGGRVILAHQSVNERAEFGTEFHVIKNGATPGGSGWTTQSSNDWGHSVAAGPRGEVAIAHDSFKEGESYNIGVTVLSSNLLQWAGQGVQISDRFEARPAAAYDPRGRLWIAYEEGPAKWGEDYGALVPAKGNPLFSSRSVRVVCIDTDGKLKRPAAELPTSTVEPPTLPFDGIKVYQYEHGTRYAYPRIGIDGKGRVWLTYRQNFGSRYTTYPGPYWLTFARRLDGDHWTEPIEVHHSDGLLDHRPALLPHKSGGLLIVHNADGRYTTPDAVTNHIYMGYVDLPGEPVEPKLVPHDPGTKQPNPAAEAHRQAVKYMRDYRVKAGGKQYRLLRGDFHRHTEISWDGEGDGSVEDLFRYAIDVAALDWIAITDHDNGDGRECTWWLTQKFTDAYHVAGAFTPLFAYERSVLYPQGHRNILFAKRGVRTLPRLLAPDEERAVGGVHADDTKMLYRYLRELGGVCAIHTSATVMGTDWRDNDPKLEPVVEIYQGDRMSYEREEAPRAGYDPQSGKEPANVAGWYPRGFVNLALEKGLRLGFQSSSDHWSTHISYFVVLAERADREGLLDAIRKRHTYGATDNIILDVRSGTHVMGDEFATDGVPRLDLTVIGTGKLAKIDVMRDAQMVATLRPEGRDHKSTWTGPAPLAGTHSYYVRILQADGQIAWSSPMWITRR